jgi:DNA-binding transcriptional ArsR family regulator
VVEASVDSGTASKWKRLAGRFKRGEETDYLFRLSDGRPLPVVGEPDPVFQRWGLIRDPYAPRGVAGKFDPRNPVAILLRLRALLGVNARCDILLYLMLNPSGTPRAMARACGYEPVTVVKALREMADSGLLNVRKEGRYTVYRVEAQDWRRLLVEKDVGLPWIDWPQLFGALERMAIVLDRVARSENTDLAQASALRRVLEEGVVDALEKTGLDWKFGELRAVPGGALLAHVFEKMDQLLRELGV